MEHIQSTFSIKDLENFTGIKAHTIRIWEQRYNLLTPQRSEGNQRVYNLLELQKLLNIKLLYENGLKISKIAKLPPEEIPAHVLEINERATDISQVIDSFKLAMLRFDQRLFDQTYNKLLAELSFRRVFLDFFIPLLEEIGTLWQTNSIIPAHEHFVSHLIQQKLIAQSERNIQMTHASDDRVYVLFLPYGEIHDLGLLFVQYELMMRGKRSVYLGQSVPIDNLTELMNVFPVITFVSYFTVDPEGGMSKYIARFKENILTRSEDRLWLLGRRTDELSHEELPNEICLFDGILTVMDALD